MLTLARSPRTVARAAVAAALLLGSFLPATRAATTADTEAELVLHALALLGVPYRWGGNDPARGLDCSGLVRLVFKNAVSLELPRRSHEMSKLGQPVRRAELRAGDLLFFNTLGYANSHVALYMGDGRFVHAPGRNGHVRVDELDDRYWTRRFNGARRIDLSEQGGAVVARSAPPPAPRHLSVEDYPNGP